MAGDTHDVAIVGMGLRLPGGITSPDELWKVLVRGENVASEFPRDRLNIDGLFHPTATRQGSLHFRKGHFLNEDIKAFDTSFFAISADEATAMDPQQRLLLEVTMEALDRAGVDRSNIRKTETGVWMGSFNHDYEKVSLRDQDDIPTYAATGNGIAILSNRISWFLDINGPSMTIDTGCSSGMVCIHAACQALLSGEVDFAIAGGVNLILLPDSMLGLSAMRFLSPDGKCFAFDSRANGYGRGEGASVLVLKRLDDAVRDNDTIRGIIRGSRVNQDGRTTGITHPSSEAQALNIQNTYKRAGLQHETAQTVFVECHGTGTPAGDSCEAEAISSTLCKNRSSNNPVYVGSLKTIVGHLEAGSGPASVIKTILCIEKETIPKNANFELPGNPAIDFNKLRIKVPTEETPWPAPGVRRASINCFGFGGTNSHLILDGAAHYLASRDLYSHHNMAACNGMKLDCVSKAFNQEIQAVIDHRTFEAIYEASGHVLPPRNVNAYTFVFSGHEQVSLTRIIADQIDYLTKKKQTDDADPAFLQNLAYTLGCRRTKMKWKASAAASSIDELISKLQGLSQTDFIRSSEDKPSSVAFVFSGQGAQWFAMGRELMGFDIFLNSIVQASKYIGEKLGSPFSLLAQLLKDKDTSQVDDPAICQPATTAIQVALVDLMVQFFGIKPASVFGHSSGEIAAAYAMGAISRQTAWELAYYRGASVDDHTRSSNSRDKGEMLAVELSADGVQPYLKQIRGGMITIACVNSPVSVTLSGDTAAIAEIRQELDAEQIYNRSVANVAYHSPHMSKCASQYLLNISELQAHQPTHQITRHPSSEGRLVNPADVDVETAKLELIPDSEVPVMYSSVTGDPIDWQELTPLYWAQNMLSPVAFSDAVANMCSRRGRTPDVILELSPRALLQKPINEIMAARRDNRYQRIPYLSLLHRDRNALDTLLTTTGHLWAHGCNVDMSWVTMRNIQFRQPKLLVDLPNYPWNHSVRYWHESEASEVGRLEAYGRQDLVGRRVIDALPAQPRWRGFFRMHENPWIEQHKCQGTTLYPAAGMLAMAIEGAKQLAIGPIVGFEILNFKIESAMIIPTTTQGLEFSLSMYHQEDNRYAFSIHSKHLDKTWKQNAQGNIQICLQPSASDSNIGNEAGKDSEKYQQLYTTVMDTCDEKISPHQLYEALSIVGISYGPLFRNITTLRRTEDTAAFTLRIPETRSVMPDNFEFEHMIHPATLDAIIQTGFAFFQGEAMIPSSIDYVYISANPELPVGPGTPLVGCCEVSRHNSRETGMDFVASDDSWTQENAKSKNKPLVLIKNMTFTSLTAKPDGGKAEFLPYHENLCSQVVWQPIISTDPTSDPGRGFSVGPEDISTQSSDPMIGKSVVPEDTFLLVPDSMGESLTILSSKMQELLKCQVCALRDLNDQHLTPGSCCLSLLEAVHHQNFIWDCSEPQFNGLQRLFRTTDTVFWVTQGAQFHTSNPMGSLFAAIARTVTSEDAQKKVFTFDIGMSQTRDVMDLADIIVKRFTMSLNSLRVFQYADVEFAESQGRIMRPRLELLKPLNDLIQNGSAANESKVCSENTSLPAQPQQPHPVRNSLNPNGTYVLAGQGGLAMHIAKLLASHGVKYIALLSRSGSSKETTKAAVRSLQHRGVIVKVCEVDICDGQKLKQVVEVINKTMPPVRGLFQCAAVIRDAMFERMEFQDWQTAIRPKTIGSLNLFGLFSRESGWKLDFFILLSSSVGVIGNRGQANYAAGNAFQDALARHIQASPYIKTQAVSIDFGPVLGVGMLAEDPRILDMLKMNGFFGIRLNDVDKIIEYAISGFTGSTGSKDTAIPAQIVVGVGTGGLVRQNSPLDPYWIRMALFEDLNQVDMPEGEDLRELFYGSGGNGEGQNGEKTKGNGIRAKLDQATSEEEAQVIVTEGLKKLLAQSMNMANVEDVDEDKPPNAYGVDSLVASSVRSWVFRECGVEISLFNVLSDESIAELSAGIVMHGKFGSENDQE